MIEGKRLLLEEKKHLPQCDLDYLERAKKLLEKHRRVKGKKHE
jgi:hypothetical protein